MNERIASLVVAQRAVEPIWTSIQNENLVARRLGKFESTGQAELEGHVETHRKAGTTKVMNRKTARAHEIADARQSSVAFLRNLQDAVRLLAEENK